MLFTTFLEDNFIRGGGRSRAIELPCFCQVPLSVYLFTYLHCSIKVVRGCIDGKTPLLCENQRPGVYSGPWPILYCCDRDLCNKDAVPTLPPWASQVPTLPPWASHKQGTSCKHAVVTPADHFSLFWHEASLG